MVTMKIAVIDTKIDAALPGPAREFLPKLLRGLSAAGHEIHLITDDPPGADALPEAKPADATLHVTHWSVAGFVEETAPLLAGAVNDIGPDAYLIWASKDVAWVALPLLDPQIATLAVGHDDSEFFYLPARHYRQFLTRLVGTSPEVCVGFVLSSVVEKEKIEWISFEPAEGETPGADFEARIIENYERCFEKAVADAAAAPRASYADFPLVETSRSRLPMWLRKLKARLAG